MLYRRHRRRRCRQCSFLFNEQSASQPACDTYVEHAKVKCQTVAECSSILLARLARAVFATPSNAFVGSPASQHKVCIYFCSAFAYVVCVRACVCSVPL